MSNTSLTNTRTQNIQEKNAARLKYSGRAVGDGF